MTDDEGDDQQKKDQQRDDRKQEHAELYPIEHRKEIVDFWLNNGSPRKFESVQHRYKLVTSIEVLRQWKHRIYGGEGTLTIVFC